AKEKNTDFPQVWGVTPVVRKTNGGTVYEDNHTVQITNTIEEKLLTSTLSGEMNFSLVELKEMERILGQQRIQFSDLYRDDDTMEVGEFIKAQVFLLGTISGTQGEEMSLSLVDATTKEKYAQVNARIPPDPTPPPEPLSLSIKMRAEPVEGEPTIAPARDLTDGSVVYSREGMSISATLSESAYLYVFIRFSQGDVFPVFPAIEGSIFYAPDAPQNPLPGKTRTGIPASMFCFAWDDHSGEEIVLFVASRTPLTDLDDCVKTLVQETDMSISNEIWEETLASAYLTRGVSGVKHKKQQDNTPLEMEFKSRGSFVGGSVLLHHR
ncbi:MAG: DUF4384 domain-containing protein, partial [Planctomycetes bacterium]|nr:DUF4384 domain-containing protein [Planctomycetota bacterium]